MNNRTLFNNVMKFILHSFLSVILRVIHGIGNLSLSLSQYINISLRHFSKGF